MGLRPKGAIQAVGMVLDHKAAGHCLISLSTHHQALFISVWKRHGHWELQIDIQAIASKHGAPLKINKHGMCLQIKWRGANGWQLFKYTNNYNHYFVANNL